MTCPKIQITFTPDMLEQLKKMAESSGNSVASVVRQAVLDYFKKQGVVSVTC